MTIPLKRGHLEYSTEPLDSGKTILSWKCLVCGKEDVETQSNIDTRLKVLGIVHLHAFGR